MTPMEKHQSQVAARVLEELKKRSMEGYYCRTAQEAADLVSSLIADGETVTFGGSMTIGETGILDALKSSVFRPEAGAGHRRHEQSQRDFRRGRQPGQKHRCPCQLSAAEQGDSLCQDRRVRQLPVPRLHLLPDRHYPPLLSRRTDQGHPDRGQLGLLKLYPVFVRQMFCTTNMIRNTEFFGGTYGKNR